MTQKITVEKTIDAPIKKIWEFWTKPEHIAKWNHASEDWCTRWAKNDVREGEKFVIRMEACDGSTGFDFEGTYTKVEEEKRMEYSMSDGRTVTIVFEKVDGGYKVTETFDPETVNSPEIQKDGWQAILDNFKKYTESN